MKKREGYLEEVLALETRLKISLPLSYRQFLVDRMKEGLNGYLIIEKGW